MSARIRRRGRHHAGYKLSERARMVRGVLLWALLLAALFAVGGLAQPVPSQAATVGASASPDWARVLGELTWCYQHRTAGHGLLICYVDHDALGFLRSGVTSGSGGRQYLRWLALHHVAPVDW